MRIVGGILVLLAILTVGVPIFLDTIYPTWWQDWFHSIGDPVDPYGHTILIYFHWRSTSFKAALVGGFVGVLLIALDFGSPTRNNRN